MVVRFETTEANAGNADVLVRINCEFTLIADKDVRVPGKTYHYSSP